MEWVLAVLLGVLVIVGGVQWLALLRLKKQRNRAAPPLDEVLPEGVAPRPHMLFYFYSEHCGHCRHVTPLIETLEQQHEGVVKVDVRRHIQVARRFGIMGTPSLVRVDNGIISNAHVGVINPQQLQKFLAD